MRRRWVQQLERLANRMEGGLGEVKVITDAVKIRFVKTYSTCLRSLKRAGRSSTRRPNQARVERLDEPDPLTLDVQRADNDPRVRALGRESSQWQGAFITSSRRGADAGSNSPKRCSPRYKERAAMPSAAQARPTDRNITLFISKKITANSIWGRPGSRRVIAMCSKRAGRELKFRAPRHAK